MISLMVRGIAVLSKEGLVIPEDEPLLTIGLRSFKAVMKLKKRQWRA